MLGLGRGLGVLVAVASAACHEERGAPVVVAADSVASPAADDAPGLCADVGQVRACWGDTVRLFPRPLPVAHAVSGWRCWGGGDSRRCAERAHGVGRFDCRGETCTQHHPRAPDDGAWECADIDGAVYCRGGDPPAGVVPGPPDPGFSCGPLRTADAGVRARRMCLDLAPDLPGEGSWSCGFHYAAGDETRVCKRSDASVYGTGCDSSEGCPVGGACVGGRCLPAHRPTPECWLDTDCDPGAICRYATCMRP